jgi:hypothetical protein
MKGAPTVTPTARAFARVPADVLAYAQVVHVVTLAEARALPNLLGRLCAGALTHRAWYGCTREGVRTLYIRRDEVTTR